MKTPELGPFVDLGNHKVVVLVFPAKHGFVPLLLGLDDVQPADHGLGQIDGAVIERLQRLPRWHQAALYQIYGQTKRDEAFRPALRIPFMSAAIRPADNQVTER